MESILLSIKKLLGVSAEYEHFDPDILMHINTVFVILHDLGVGPKEGFSISDSDAVWVDFIDPDEDISVAMVKSYMHARVKLLFDPPVSSTHVETLNRVINEFEWRLNSRAETTSQKEETQNE
jgi:hypothetical protein